MDWVLPKTPEESPTWTMVVVSVVVVAVTIPQIVSAEPISWTGLALGILIVWLVAGPIATSPIGRRIDAWDEDTGFVTSIGVVCVVIAVLAALALLIPSRMEPGLTVGFLLGTVGWFLVHVVSAGDVSGWL